MSAAAAAATQELRTPRLDSMAEELVKEGNWKGEGRSDR